MNCPICTATIYDTENGLLLILNPEEEFQEIKPKQESEEEKIKLQEFLATLDLVSCPCGNLMEVYPGEVEKNLKDSKGYQVSEAAALHHS